MTNKQIIKHLTDSLKATGMLQQNEELNTKSRWESMGYSIKDGMQAIVETRLWLHTNTNGKKKDHFFMTDAALYSTQQVRC